MSSYKAKLKGKGIISVQALWILMILSTLAISLAARATFTIKLASREIANTKASFMARSYARILEDELAMSDSVACRCLGKCQHDFQTCNLAVESDTFAIQISPGLWPINDTLHDVEDEESKININMAPEFVLNNIFGDSRVVDEILDKRILWHKENRIGNDDISQGSNSKINQTFRIVDEIILLDSAMCDSLDFYRRILTTFGSGRVNIYTASSDVLRLTGCPQSLIEKLLELRGNGIQKGGSSIRVDLMAIETITAYLIANGISILPDEANYLKLMQNYKLLGACSEYYSFSITCTQLNGTGKSVCSRAINMNSADTIGNEIEIAWP